MEGDCRVAWLGRIGYMQALELQRRLAESRLAGDIPDTLLLLEHPPTITLGRAAKPEHLLATPEELRRIGVELVETDRGGDITYHGPGQLIGYPILNLREPPLQPDLHWYLRGIEQSLIRALATLGTAADRFPGNTGVWVGMGTDAPRKIAAIGIRCSRWIVHHGFALNVQPIMSHFDLIVPCGIHDYAVTSLSAELGRNVAVQEILPEVEAAFLTVFALSRTE
jgi:lipoyl(octanoyl) transferase